VLITPQLERAGHDPDGAVAYVLKCLEQRRIPVKTIAAGYACRIGHARWNWLHPPADQRFERTNDASMVVRIEVAGRAVLLTGDVEAEALTMLSALGPGLQVDVLELPHHGSDTVEARQFVQMADPSVVLQSTGWSRWRMDTWGEDLGAIQRLVTARDGACTVDIGRCGQITTSRFVLR
jgi:competence protein ComEC